MIDDPSNVECVQCGLVWHGKCKPQKGSSIDGQWACAKCTKKEKTDKYTSPYLSSKIPFIQARHG